MATIDHHLAMKVAFLEKEVMTYTLAVDQLSKQLAEALNRLVVHEPDCVQQIMEPVNAEDAAGS